MREVRQALGGEVKEFQKSSHSATLSDHFIEHDAIAYYDAHGRLNAVELFGSAVIEWSGIQLIGRHAKTVFDDVERHSSKAEVDGDGATFHDLGLACMCRDG